ncbi:unnamed protein product [Euphydryas editha]|uniref:Uncharacterized protein n=1 Tax=Euphydryas editha TaxID=104508 RepID=A0AAU9V050_EUPED|nr:unnamed protein product [Euphydryas editha]
MILKFIGALFLIYILNPGKVLSFEQCTEFTVMFYEIKDLDTFYSFERDSFGITNNLTKQCRNLNVAIELDLDRDKKKSEHYKKLYGDDLTKLTVTYPLDENVTEEIDLHPECPIPETKDSKKQDDSYLLTRYQTYIPEYLYPNETEFPTDYAYYTTEYILESTKAPKNSEQHAENPTEKKIDSKVMIVVLTTLTGVALLSAVSYFMYQIIKTKLQSGSFRFPESAA